MTTIELSLNEAIALAAKQNLERDQRLDLMPRIQSRLTKKDLDLYREEAEYLLREMGENYLPEYPDHQLIKVKKEK